MDDKKITLNSTPDGVTTFDDEKQLSDWGFTDNYCHHCGKKNSEISGLLMQCGRCKKAYYCSQTCFQDGYAKHSIICNTGKSLSRIPTGSVLQDYQRIADDETPQVLPTDSCSYVEAKSKLNHSKNDIDSIELDKVQCMPLEDDEEERKIGKSSVEEKKKKKLKKDKNPKKSKDISTIEFVDGRECKSLQVKKKRKKKNEKSTKEIKLKQKSSWEQIPTSSMGDEDSKLGEEEEQSIEVSTIIDQGEECSESELCEEVHMMVHVIRKVHEETCVVNIVKDIKDSTVSVLKSSGSVTSETSTTEDSCHSTGLTKTSDVGVDNFDEVLIRRGSNDNDVRTTVVVGTNDAAQIMTNSSRHSVSSGVRGSIDNEKGTTLRSRGSYTTLDQEVTSKNETVPLRQTSEASKPDYRGEKPEWVGKSLRHSSHTNDSILMKDSNPNDLHETCSILSDLSFHNSATSLGLHSNHSYKIKHESKDSSKDYERSIQRNLLQEGTDSGTEIVKLRPLLMASSKPEHGWGQPEWVSTRLLLRSVDSNDDSCGETEGIAANSSDKILGASHGKEMNGSRHKAGGKVLNSSGHFIVPKLRPVEPLLNRSEHSWTKPDWAIQRSNILEASSQLTTIDKHQPEATGEWGDDSSSDISVDEFFDDDVDACPVDASVKEVPSSNQRDVVRVTSQVTNKILSLNADSNHSTSSKHSQRRSCLRSSITTRPSSSHSLQERSFVYQEKNSTSNNAVWSTKSLHRGATKVDYGNPTRRRPEWTKSHSLRFTQFGEIMKSTGDIALPARPDELLESGKVKWEKPEWASRKLPLKKVHETA